MTLYKHGVELLLAHCRLTLAERGSEFTSREWCRINDLIRACRRALAENLPLWRCL